MIRTTIKDIFSQYGREYIQRFGKRMPADHRKVIDAIINCRSGHYGASIYQCTQCGKNHVVYRCCGNTAEAARKRRIAPIVNTIRANIGCLKFQQFQAAFLPHPSLTIPLYLLLLRRAS